MSAFDDIIITVFVCGSTFFLSVGLIYVSYHAYRLMKRLANAADSLPNLVEANECILAEIQKLQQTANNLGWELSQFRAMMTPQVPGGLGGDPGLAQTPQQPPQTPPFPTPEWSRYRTQPARDAVMDDTDMELLEQTDEDLLTAQRVETLRQAGLAHDVQPPGVMMEAE